NEDHETQIGKIGYDKIEEIYNREKDVFEEIPSKDTNFYYSKKHDLKNQLKETFNSNIHAIQRSCQSDRSSGSFDLSQPPYNFFPKYN
ncbi:MAG: hypothetical protein ABEH43_06530, partial [Flavobacteriales bacterium]